MMIRETALQHLNINKKDYTVFNIMALEEQKIAQVKKLPFSIRVLLENLLRRMDSKIVTKEDVINVATSYENGTESSFLIPSKIKRPFQRF